MYGLPNYNQGFNPYQERLNMLQQQMPQAPMNMPQQGGLVRVTGIEGAKAYQMAANSVAALFDGSEDVFYIKQTDGAGFPTIRVFEFKERLNAQSASNAEYVTRAEFNETINKFMEVLNNGKQFISVQSTNATAEQAANANA